MIKSLVATALLSASFIANAAVVTTTSEGFNALGNVSKAGNFTDSFDYTFTQKSDVNSVAQLFRFFTKNNIQSATLTISGLNAPSNSFNFSAAGEEHFLGTFAANQKYTFTIAGFKQGDKLAQWNLSSAVAPVPEPETYALMGMGLVGLLAARRRKAKQA